MKKYALSLSILLVASKAFAGGGWTYQKGKGFIKLGQSAIYANQYFTPDGSIEDITTVGYYSTSLYAEYGISDRFTAIAYMPFFSRNTLNKTKFRFSGRELPGDELNSFGDMDLSLQYGILQGGKWVLSARVLLGLPTGQSSGGDTGILQTGDGEFNQMLRFDLSRGFASKGWFSVYAGYNNRTKGFSDDYRFGAEVGWTFWSKLFTIAKLNVVQSTLNGTVEASQTGTLFSNNMEFVSPELEVAYQNDKNWGVSMSVAGAFEAQNVLAAPNYAVGIYHKF